MLGTDLVFEICGSEAAAKRAAAEMAAAIRARRQFPLLQRVSDIGDGKWLAVVGFAYEASYTDTRRAACKHFNYCDRRVSTDAI